MEKEIKRPKYKIGDIVIYPDRYFKKEKDGMLHYYQSKIIRSHALLDTDVKDDTLSWYYVTEHVDEDQEDCLDEDDILLKL